jgi:hypothetical protein
MAEDDLRQQIYERMLKDENLRCFSEESMSGVHNHVAG